MDIARKTSKLIEYLMDGQCITIDDEVYSLRDNYELCVRREVINSAYKSCGYHVWIKIFGDVNLAYYKSLAEKMTDEDLFLVGANKVLNDINQHS